MVCYAFQGGEPTLAGLDFYRAFVAQVQRCNTRKIAVSYAIQTNGLTLSSDWAAFFTANRFLIGVSLDGRRAEHDRYRVDHLGGGTYERVRKNLKLLREAGADFNILSVVTNAFVGHPEKVFNALRPYGYLQFLPCIDPMDGGDCDFSITGEEYGRFLIKLFALYEEAFYSKNPVSIRTFDNYVQMLLGNLPEHCGMAGACGPHYVIESDGSVYPCDFYMLDPWRLGSICETSFFRLFKTPLRQSFVKASLPLPEECRQCPWLMLCRNGCRRDRLDPFGETPGRNKLCPGYRLFFGQCHERLKRIAASQNEQRRESVI